MRDCDATPDAPANRSPRAHRTHRPRRLRGATLAALATLSLALARDADATPTLQDYLYFRALTIDLTGRMPTRDEVAAFEQPGFDVDHWIDQHLTGPAYAERVRRIYMDLMRLDVGSSFQFVPGNTTLRRQQITGPTGQPIYVYFRQGQRRAREATDGEFCMTQDETGLQFPRNTTPTGTAHAVTQAVLDANTVVVRPWWLYRDYRASSPSDRYDAMAWATRIPGYVPVPGLLTEPDGMTATTTIRVCREEAQTAANGTVYATMRMAPARGAVPPYGRLTQLPLDSTYATQHHGEAIACNSGTALANSADCGCGVGLERCMPGASPSFDPQAFAFPSRTPLGFDAPLDQTAQAQSSWQRYWWGQEAVHFLDAVLTDDRPFTEVLTAPYSYVNGPLAQFYRNIAPSTCCGNGTTFNYVTAEPLFDPAGIPTDLLPHDAARWVRVENRGAHASGLLTMPVFLTKYGSRRARAHVLYQAFLCRDFVAANVRLAPSTEANLMLRPGCSTCHATLEPLAAYFSRVLESDWTWLPPARFPLDNPTCANADPTRIPRSCSNYYDPAFTSAMHATLRGAYASSEHAEAGPSGLASSLAGSPEFASCVVNNVTSSFLGRPLTTDDDALTTELTTAFTTGQLHMRSLVRALVRSDAYRQANDLASTVWRNGGAQ